MVMEILKSIVQMLWIFIKWPLIILCLVVAAFFISVGVFFFIEYKKGRRLPEDSVRKLPKKSIPERLFVDAPKMFVEDRFNRPPDFFQPQGLVVFTGRQGGGKSSGLMQYVLDLQYQYPKCKVISNTAYKYQDAKLDHWKRLIDYKNGQMGVVAIMDELQNWFSSNQSRNFPPEMLSVITQNRKNRRLILGTAQNFYLLAKPIRSQVTEVRNCITLAGVITIVTRREPILDSDGEVKEMKRRGTYFFVHSRELRECYDTWATVESLAKKGFHDNPFLRDESKINVIAEEK